MVVTGGGLVTGRDDYRICSRTLSEGDAASASAADAAAYILQITTEVARDFGFFLIAWIAKSNIYVCAALVLLWLWKLALLDSQIETVFCDVLACRLKFSKRAIACLSRILKGKKEHSRCHAERRNSYRNACRLSRSGSRNWWTFDELRLSSVEND